VRTFTENIPCIIRKPNKTKVLFIQPGYAHYRYALFNLLHKNHDVTFVFIRNEATYPSKLSPNPEWNMLFLDGGNSAFWVLNLAKYIFKIKPRVIITSVNGSYQTIISLITGRILKIPVILWSESWETSRFFSNRPYWKNFQHNIRIKWTTKNANAIVAGGTQSKKFNKQIAREGKPIFTAYQSTEDQSLMERIQLPTTSKRAYLDELTILYLSRIVEYKGLDILIRAFSEIEKNCEHTNLIIAGDGPFREYCENLSKTLRVKNITFYGAIQNEDAWKLYKKADIFVLPCSGRNGIEAWGLVINEATSMGLPIVTTNAVGAVGDLVKDGGNGFIVDAGSVSELRFVIEALISDETKRNRMGKESRKLFESINSYQKMYKGFNNAIKSVICKK
jgi:glycosyltransferase involved in cell wall biosynthesis